LKMAANFTQTWNDVTKFWGGVSLDEPDVITDQNRARKEMQDSIAFIDMKTRKIKVNHPKMSKDLGADKLKPVEGHEVAHHKFCPYDLRTGVVLLSEADKVMKNLDQAKYVENIFSDTLCNTHMIKKGDKSIIGVYKKMSAGNGGSEFWNLYMKTCENLWGLPEKTLAPAPSEKVNCDAKKLEDIVKKVIYKPDKWPKGMRRFAKVVKDYIKNSMNSGCQNNQGSSSQSTGGGGGSGSGAGQPNQQGKQQGQQPGQQSVPANQGNQNQSNQKANPLDGTLIDKHSPKDFAPQGKDKAAESEIERKLKGAAKGMNGDPEQYTRVVAGTGLGSITKALKWFYRDIASMFDIDMPETEMRASSETPETFIDWDVHDEDSKLDVLYSIIQHGVIIPGFTTYQQKYKEGQFGQRGNSAPDLLICIDSSSSMPNPSTSLSPAVLSAIVAARKAINYDKRVAVVNFSSNYDILKYTRNRDKIDDALVNFLGGGTDIPGYELLKLVQKNPNPQHILIISDAEIGNLTTELSYLDQAIQKAKAGGSIFLINPSAGSSQQLEKIGYDVIRVTNPNDLIGVTLSKTKSIYGG
jgi:hypothetical protein